MQSGEAGPDEAPDVVAVLVHGIGSQAPTSVLIHWGGAIHDWLERWAEESAHHLPRTVEVHDAVGAGSGPGRADLTVTVGERSHRVRLVEGLWADEVVAPSFTQLGRWLFLQLPLVVVHHVGRAAASARLRAAGALRGGSVARLLGVVAAAVAGVATLLAPVVVALATLALWGVIGALLLVGTVARLVPGLGGPLRSLRAALVASVGDTYFVLANDVQRNLVVERVRRVVEQATCTVRPGGRVVVLAHSQGAWVAHRALSAADVEDDTVELLTFGQGLAKIERLRVTVGGDTRWALLFGSALTAAAALGAVSRPDLLTWQTLWPAAVAVVVSLTTLAGLAAVAVLAGRLLERTGQVDAATAEQLGVWVALAAAAGVVGAVQVTEVGRRSVAWLEAVNERPEAILLAISAIGMYGLTHAMRRVGDVELRRPTAVRFWTDVWATADPVPNGRLFGTKDRVRDEHHQVESIRIENLRDPVRDHNAYWANSESFVTRVVTLLLPAGWINDGFAADADRHRTWTSRWALLVRTAGAGLALWIGATAGLAWTDLPAWAPGREALVDWAPVGAAPWGLGVGIGLVAVALVEAAVRWFRGVLFQPVLAAPYRIEGEGAAAVPTGDASSVDGPAVPAGSLDLVRSAGTRRTADGGDEVDTVSATAGR